MTGWGEALIVLGLVGLVYAWFSRAPIGWLGLFGLMIGVGVCAL